MAGTHLLWIRERHTGQPEPRVGQGEQDLPPPSGSNERLAAAAAAETH